MVLSGLPVLAGVGQVDAGSDGWGGALIADAGWRVEVIAAAQGAEIGSANLDRRDSGEWVVVVADVTNLGGAAASFPADAMTVGVGESTGGAVEGTVLTDLNLREGPSIEALILTGMPAGATVTITGEPVDGFYPVEFDGLEGFASVDGIAADGDPAAAGGGLDSDGSADAGDELGTSDLAAEVDAGDTARLTLAFAVGDGSEDVALVFGGSLPLAEAIEADVDLTALPDLAAPSLAPVDVANVGSDGTIELAGGETITLLGSVLPDEGACFSGEARDRLEDLTSNETLFEPATGDDSRGYLWVSTDDGIVLANAELLESGFADADFGDATDTRAEGWFESAREAAEANEAGLWGECTGFNGDERPEPTVPPTPTPGPAEVRAEYPPLSDVREIAIRPGNYIGDQFQFSGRIFNIQVAGPGEIATLGDQSTYRVSAVLQVYVLAPDGTEEAVFIGYDGDTAGMFEGTYVTIYGEMVGTQSFVNGFGGEISQPLVIAEFIDIA